MADKKNAGETPQPAPRVRGDEGGTDVTRKAVEKVQATKEKLKKAKRVAAARKGHETKAKQRKAAGKKTVKEEKAAERKRKKVNAAAKKRTAAKKSATKRKPGKDPGTIPHITAAKYNMLWEEYCRSQSIQKCAEFADVGYDTARKYITGKGQPKLGLVPIRQRHINAMAEAQEQQEMTLAEFQAAKLKDVERFIALHVAELGLCQKNTLARLEKYEKDREKARKAGSDDVVLPEIIVTLDKLSKSFETMVRTAEHLLGGADMSIETRERSRFEGWTEEECLAYATQGIVPEHSR